MLRLVVVFAFLVFCNSSYAQSSSPRKGEITPPVRSTAKPPENDQKVAIPGPITVNVLPLPKTEEELNAERHDREEKAQLDRRLVDLTGDVAKFTGFLVAATLGLFLATGALWWSTRRLVRGAEFTGQRQLRAYVFVKGGGVVLHQTQKIQAQVQLFNSGQTPGYDFKTWTAVRIGPPGEKVVGERKEWKQSSIIAPGAEFNAPSDTVELAEAQIRAIIEKTLTVYVWGEATYRDAFGKIWIFEFCDTGDGPTSVLNPVGSVMGWGLAPKGYRETEIKS